MEARAEGRKSFLDKPIPGTVFGIILAGATCLLIRDTEDGHSILYLSATATGVLSAVTLANALIPREGEGLGPMDRPEARPHDPPRRPDHDVYSALPNHRSTPPHAISLPGWSDPKISENGIDMSDRLTIDNIGNLVIGERLTWKG